MFTVAGTQTDVEAEKKVQVPSPEPKPRSKSPSESSYTESSSISETFNECVSEGQWLINKSDGEVADFPIDEGSFQIMYQTTLRLLITTKYRLFRTLVKSA